MQLSWGSWKYMLMDLGNIFGYILWRKFKENLLWTQIWSGSWKEPYELRLWICRFGGILEATFGCTCPAANLTRSEQVRMRYERGPMCSLAPPLAHFLYLSLSFSFFLFLSHSFSFFLFLSLSLYFFPFLSFSAFFFFCFLPFSFLLLPFLPFPSFSLLVFVFLPFLPLSFTVCLYFLLSFGHWHFSKCNSMTAPAHVNASWSNFTWSFPPR